MTPYQYAVYLNQRLGEETLPQAASRKPQEDEDIFALRDRFYVFFQSFMPDGDGVGPVFAPLSGGNALWQRLRPVYTISAAHSRAAFDAGGAPGYFVATAIDDTGRLYTIGQA